ncbi:MAG: DUF350 domain-containing protein [Elusimicrobiales bacterium]|nr:DUF350 domain-containing protein [Elusimicrobiales bacterium]
MNARIWTSFVEFGLAVLMSGFIIALIYKVFIKANPDFDMEAEIKKGNIAVGTLMGAIVFAAAMILQRGMGAVISMSRMYFSSPGEYAIRFWKLLLISMGHLVFSMLLAVITISVALRLFGRLAPGLKAGKRLKEGNLAIGILLASVVLVAAMYVGEGVSAVTKAMVPQPSIGRIEILR